MSEKASTVVQLRDFRSQIPPELLRKWDTPTGVRCTVKIVQDWTIILAAHQLFVRIPSVLTFLAAMVLMSWGQRGLSTLAHDSMHGNLFRNRARNDLVGDIFLAPPAMSTTSIPRQTHAAYHQYLGTEKDPDHGASNGTSLQHYRNGRYDHKSILSLWLYDVADPLAIKQTALGDVLEAPVFVISWWVAMNLLMGLVGPRSILAFGWIRISSFSILFHTARCTLGYACYVLREIIDHSGLPVHTVMQFTRSSPWGSTFQKYLQPHDDNYHLLHHLLPKVPMSRLHEADAWLTENVEVYRQANQAGLHCCLDRQLTNIVDFEAYLVGENPLFTQSLHDNGLETPGYT